MRRPYEKKGFICGEGVQGRGRGQTWPNKRNKLLKIVKDFERTAFDQRREGGCKGGQGKETTRRQSKAKAHPPARRKTLKRTEGSRLQERGKGLGTERRPQKGAF